jgi:tight adherence protein B
MFSPIASILVFAAVFFATVVIFSVLRAAYARYQERYLAKAIEDLSGMFLFLDRRQMLTLNACSILLLGTVGYVLVNPLACAICAASGVFFPRLLVSFYRKRRIRRFNVELVDALQSMASALRAGLTFTQAVEHVSKESSAPLAQEFGLLVKEVKLGVPLDQAMTGMAQRVGSEDLELIVVSANIARSLGGNMAEMFETISRTIRERFRLEGKIDAMTSQGRLQGWIVAAMPLALAVVLNFMRPDLMQPMLGHPFGYVLLASIAILETLGILWIRRIVQVDI